jgi:hypothetical protein
MSWLDALGPLKWPSLLLVLSPVVAYPFWLPQPVPARPCGQVRVGAQTFDAHQGADGKLLLHPSLRPNPRARLLSLSGEATFENGAMVVTTDIVRSSAPSESHGQLPGGTLPPGLPCNY